MMKQILVCAMFLMLAVSNARVLDDKPQKASNQQGVNPQDALGFYDNPFIPNPIKNLLNPVIPYVPNPPNDPFFQPDPKNNPPSTPSVPHAPVPPTHSAAHTHAPPKHSTPHAPVPPSPGFYLPFISIVFPSPATPSPPSNP